MSDGAFQAKISAGDLVEWAKVIVDTRNALGDIKVPAGKVWKA